jgi:hypothetical protein
MNSFVKLIIALSLIFIVAALTVPVDAVKPTYTGVKYPVGAGIGTVTGKVVTSVNGTIGLADAYIAIVNAMDVSQEYANTTSDSNGYYTFTGVNASGDNSYKIYANKSPYGEGYSASFGVNVNDTTVTAVVIFLPESNGPTSSPTPTPTATPTPTPVLVNNTTASLTPTPTPTSSPAPSASSTATPVPATPKPTPAIPVLMAAVIMGFVAYYIGNRR